MKLRGLPYYGGKNVLNPVGQWVAQHLPYSRMYVEPFAGMLGVLLQRKASAVEIVNDTDHNLVNWWRHVRDKPADLKHLVMNTPRSREEYSVQQRLLREGNLSNLRRALAYHVVLSQSRASSANEGGWQTSYARGFDGNRAVEDSLYLLSKRLRGVQIENRDAVDLLDRIKEYDDAVVYCDPPYSKSNVTAYGNFTFDRERFGGSVTKLAGKVAVSGKEDEWDSLGWHKVSMKRPTWVADGEKKVVFSESLWMNYEPIVTTLFEGA